MFIVLIILILYLCVLSMYIAYKVSEIEEDINTLYDNYAKEIEKLYKINTEKGVNNGTSIC